MAKRDITVGDIVFEDSDRKGARIAKFFMTAPNMFLHVYRAITKTQEKVEYYHPFIIYSPEKLIEQQWKVVFDNKDNFNQNKYIVFRRVNATPEDITNLLTNARLDLGQKWGVFHTIFGRFPTWLTGISFFARHIKLPNEEVSAGRVARWLCETYGETFGKKTYQECTTHDMVKYMKKNRNYKIIYKRG